MEPFGLEMKIARLRKVPILQEWTRRELMALAKRSEVIEVEEGRVVVRTGDTGAEFFLILAGQAVVEVSPRRRVRLGPGEFFGEMSLLDGAPRSATVVAESALRLLVVRRPEFWMLLAEVPDLTRRILLVLCQRVRLTQGSLLD